MTTRHALRLIGLCAGVWVTLWATGAAALYTPNPAGRWPAQHFSIAGDFQFNAEKDVEGGEIDDIVGFFARPGYSVARNVMFYGRLGVQDAEHLDAGFASGFGVQGAYVPPRAQEWAIGGAFDFLYWDTETANGREFDFIEFQFAPAVSYRVPTVPSVTPYGGFALDLVSGDVDEDDPFGLLFGTNFDPNPDLRLDLQFRVISETGVAFSLAYLF